MAGGCSAGFGSPAWGAGLASSFFRLLGIRPNREKKRKNYKNANGQKQLKNKLCARNLVANLPSSNHESHVREDPDLVRKKKITQHKGQGVKALHYNRHETSHAILSKVYLFLFGTLFDYLFVDHVSIKSIFDTVITKLAKRQIA